MFLLFMDLGILFIPFIYGFRDFTFRSLFSFKLPLRTSVVAGTVS